ncbi:MAG: hypothetical protein IPQ07_03580 [Myxococcales bacterium]|nr:hypothetical protein [Myxococcales bacterium]
MPIPRVVLSLLAASLVVSSLAVAGTTATVTLGGSVSSTLEITSVDTAAAGALDLSAGQKIVKVADIEMSTNNDQGLTLVATSGNLTKAGGVSIAFQVTSVADAASAPAAGAFTIPSGSDYSAATSVAGSDVSDLYIKYTPASSQDPGDYAGTIELTVSDN